jgi:protein O-GlcNAc transferase
MDEELTRARNFFFDGINHFNKREYLKAKLSFIKSLNLFPERSSVKFNLALVNYYLNDINDSKIILQNLIDLGTKDTEVIMLLVKIFIENEGINKGLEYFNSKINISDEASLGLAFLKYFQGNFEGSIDILNKIVLKNKDFYSAYFLLGKIYKEKNDLDLSLEYLLKSIEIKPDYLRSFYLIGKIYKNIGNLDLAKKYFKKFLAIRNEDVNCLIEYYFLLKPIYIDNDEVNHLRLRYKNNLKKLEKKSLKEHEKSELPDNQTFFLSYSNFNNLNLLKKQVEVFKKIFPSLNYVNKINFYNKNSKIRIGFISEFLTDHTIGKLFSELIINLDKSKFEVFIFHSSLTKPGEIKNIIDSNVFKSVTLPIFFNDKVKNIESHHLDIIFYPDIGMSSDLYYLSFLRMAKVQINTYGHPETSGSETIDYFISSLSCEISNAKNFYSEKLILFKNFMNFYKKPIFKKELYRSNNNNTYFCSQSLFKILPDYDSIIKEILEKDKKALIYFLEAPLNYWSKLLKERLGKIIKNNMDRIKFIKRMSQEDFINFCGNVDVLIDTPYFSAGTSFIEIFSYGTPMITFPGNFLRSRISSGLYDQMKIEQAPIARSVDEYVNLSIKLANDNRKNNDLRDQIISNSDKYFFSNKNIYQEFENFFIGTLN